MSASLPTPSPAAPSRRWLPADAAARYGLAWLALVAVFALRPVFDFDTFWQLQSGRHIWQTQAFIYTDIFSQAPDAFRLEHCWLHDIVLFAVHGLGGYPLLGLLQTVLIALSAALLLWWSCQRQVPAVLSLPLLTLCLLASEPSWALRPQLWTFALALLYLILLHTGREQGWRAWIWLAPLMLVWANLHAACIFGLVLIGLFAVAELLRWALGQSSRRRCLELCGCGLLTFGAAFVNPYGYLIPLRQLLAHLNQHRVAAGTAGTMATVNMEWLPPTFAQVPLFYLLMAFWGGLILWRLRRLDPAEGVFFVAFCYMGFNQIRHTTLVALLAGIYLPGAVAQLAADWQWPRRLRLLPVFVLLALVLTGLGGYRFWQGWWGFGLKTNEFPVAATDFLVQQRLPANLYNSYDWGGYLMWRLYPDYLVFVDGRSDSVEHFDASTQIDEAQPGWEATLDRHGINTILVRTCFFDTGGPVRLVDRLALHPGWALVYQDQEAVIFLRRSEGHRPWLERLALDGRQAFATRLAEAARLLREDPGKDRALLSLGLAAFKLGQFDQARGFLADYLQRVPGDREALNLQAFLAARPRSQGGAQ